MSEKRFTDIGCSETGHIGVTDYGIDKEFTSIEFEDFLNELNEENQRLKNDCSILVQSNQEYRKENEQLKQKIQRWKTLYELKDKEVTARVKRLNEICNQYKYAITFDKDIDPNDAVNILCDRILQTEVE